MRYCSIIFTFILVLATKPVALYGQVEFSENRTYALAWSPNGQYLAAVGENSQAYVIDLNDNRVTSLTGLDETIYDVTWSPDSAQLALGGDDNSLQIWAIEDSRGFAVTQTATFLAHENLLRAVAWSPDGTSIATGSFTTGRDASLKVWDASDYTEMAVASVGGVFDIEWSLDGRFVAIAQANNYVVVKTPRLEEVIPLLGDAPATSLAWSNDGTRIASGDNTGNVYIWNISTGERERVFAAHGDVVDSVEWTNDDQFLATSSRDGSVVLWDTQDFQAVDSRSTNAMLVMPMTLSPFDGRWAYISSSPNMSANLGVQEVDIQSLVDSLGISVDVPAPSSARLQAIADLCGAAPTIEQALTADIAAADYENVIAQVSELPADTLPPGCAADLLAMAQALASR